MTSALEDSFAFQLDALGLTGYVREFVAIKGRRFRFDFAYIQPEHRLLVEIQGGVWSGGAHGRPTGISRDYEKINLAVQNNWKVVQFDTKMVKNGEAIECVKRILEASNVGN